jgi:DNA adenine methylase
MKGCYIDHKDALDLIKPWDTEKTFFYFDPPYPRADQGHYAGYTMEDFLVLVDKCSEIQGKFMISSYPYPELTEIVEKEGWYQIEFDQQLSAKKSSGVGSQGHKTEVLTMNYNPREIVVR